MAYLYTSEDNIEIPSVKMIDSNTMTVYDSIPNPSYLVDFSQFPPVGVNEHFDRVYDTYKSGYSFTVRLSRDYEGDVFTSWGFTDPNGEYESFMSSSDLNGWAYLLVGFVHTTIDSTPTPPANYICFQASISTDSTNGRQELLDRWIETFGTSGTKNREFLDWRDAWQNTIFLNSWGTNPSFPGTDSDTGGGTGDFDNSSDDIDFSELPILSAVDAGFVTIYTPNTAQLKQLAQYMWTTDFVDVIKKLFGDPMDAILGLSVVPVTIPASTSKEVTVGFVGTGVTMPVASEQYIGFDCGTLNVKEYWGSALDYSPYTKCNIFLPYIGFRQLNIDDVMGKAVHLKYRIDILSGACTAQIKCGSSVVYQYSGSVAASLPVSGSDFSDIVRNAISIAGATGAMVASGGMSAPVSAGVLTSALTTTANNVMGMKPHIQHSGAVSGTGGMLGLQVPFLILERPRQSKAKNYNQYVGYPSNITSRLSALSGFTTIEEIHLENMSCTDEELKEIYQKLQEGVIL